MRASLFLIPLLLSSAACSDAENFADDAGVDTASSGEDAVAEATARAPAGEARNVTESTEAYEFEYSYPAEAGAYPVLREHLDADLDKIKAELARDANQWKTEAEQEGFPFNPYSSSTKWEVVADLPGWLSLSNELSVYTGGAHGNYGMTTLLYDKEAETIRKPLDLFISTEALWSAVESEWCARIDEARAKRRGEPVDKSDDLFGGCPPLTDLTLLLGSSNGRTFDRMTFYAGPYVAGAYAEGAYEIDIDVNASVLKAVKPDYAEDFTVRR